MSEEKKRYYFYEDKSFYPIHWINAEALIEIDIQKEKGGFDPDLRYLYGRHPQKDVVSLGSQFTRDYSDKSTPPYSAFATGKFYKHKVTEDIYYEGGFSVC